MGSEVANAKGIWKLYQRDVSTIKKGSNKKGTASGTAGGGRAMNVLGGLWTVPLLDRPPVPCLLSRRNDGD